MSFRPKTLPNMYSVSLANLNLWTHHRASPFGEHDILLVVAEEPVQHKHFAMNDRCASPQEDLPEQYAPKISKNGLPIVVPPFF
jgi:hypothetical protein